MDKKIAGLLGAAAAFTVVTGAQAAVPAPADQLAPASSYRDLLEPVPNALATLKAQQAKEVQASQQGQDSTAPAGGETRLAYYHHHHHHHRWWRRRWHHHHHHHHHW